MLQISPTITVVAAMAIIILGIIFCFRGYRNYKLIMVITGLGFGGYFAALLTQHPIGAVAGAILLAVLSASVLYFGIFMLGVLGGASLFALLTVGGSLPVALLIVLITVGGVAAIYFHKQAIVFATSLAGGLGMTTAVNEMLQLSNNQTIAPVALIMMALLFASSGALFQLGIMQQYLNMEYLEPADPLPAASVTAQPLPVRGSGASASPFQSRIVSPPALSQMPFKLVQINGNNAGKIYTISARNVSDGVQKAILGRTNPGIPVEVSVEEPSVSRCHAELMYDGKVLQIRHLSKSNPSFLNNHPIGTGESKYLKVNDVITLADIKIKLTI
jgi:hypothetical protein